MEITKTDEKKKKKKGRVTANKETVISSLTSESGRKHMLSNYLPNLSAEAQ